MLAFKPQDLSYPQLSRSTIEPRTCGSIWRISEWMTAYCVGRRMVDRDGHGVGGTRCREVDTLTLAVAGAGHGNAVTLVEFSRNG